MVVINQSRVTVRNCDFCVDDMNSGIKEKEFKLYKSVEVTTSIPPKVTLPSWWSSGHKINSKEGA